MPTVSLSAIKQNAQSQIKQVDDMMAQKGYIRNPASGGYVRDPSYQTQSDTEYAALRNKRIQQEIDNANNSSSSDPVLSVGDLATLNDSGANLPYGTTRSQASGAKVTPKKAKTATQNLEEKTYNAIKGFTSQLQGSFTPQGDLPGVGVLGEGSLQNFLYGLGANKDTKGEDVRLAIGNIKATLAKLRGGTSFTPNEEKLLNSYTPAINDSPQVIGRKLQALQNYLIYRVNASGVETTDQPTTPAKSGFKIINSRPAGK